MSINPINDPSFTGDQKNYLEGFFSGALLRGQNFADVEPDPAEKAEPEKKVRLSKEEKIKQELHPLDAFPEIRRKATLGLAPEGGDVFRFKTNGLFWLAPVEGGYMCRLRIPGGFITASQFRELGSISTDIASGFLQITNRNNVQIRIIQPENTTELLRRVEKSGLHARGSGGDNIRNITASPTAGIDPYELIDVRPLVEDLSQLIMNDREFYDLPRKFNISFNGGGSIKVAEDTNDIGLRAFQWAGSDSLPAGVYFQILLGGVTGHQEFSEHSGVICTPDQAVEVIAAMTKVFVRNGNRGNRGKARLVYLLKDWGFEKFIEQSEQEFGHQLPRLDAESIPQYESDLPEIHHPHLGAHPQKQEGLQYLGVSIPVGIIQADEVEAICGVAEKFGIGEMRLSIFQNVLIPGIPVSRIAEAEAALKEAGLSCSASRFRGGMIACTGNRYCKYAAADTKGQGIELADFIDSQIELDQPINVHVTGCPHSCAQHYIGDIGLLGCQVEVDGEVGEGFHVFVGGGFGAAKNLGRQLFKSVPVGELLNQKILALLRSYLAHRDEGQSFQSFTISHSIEDLEKLTEEQLTVETIAS